MDRVAQQSERDAGMVGFGVGDRVVHPHHGAGVVVSCERRLLLGSDRDYLEIELDHHALRIMLPCESAAGVGLRHVSDASGLARIVAVLEGTPDPMPSSWAARQKLYRARLRDGDVLEHAALVRDLAIRAAESALPTSERELYERSRRIIVSELRYTLGSDSARAAAYIDRHLACGRRGAE